MPRYLVALVTVFLGISKLDLVACRAPTCMISVQGISIEIMQPLSEVLNLSKRPRKVYGRRRVLPETQRDHLQLFGTDQNDENQIEKSLAQLSLSTKSPYEAGTENNVTDKQSTLNPSVSTTTLPANLPTETPLRHPPSQDITHTKRSTFKRHHLKHETSSLYIPLTSSEHAQLQPLLSQPNVHSNVISFPAFASKLLTKFTVVKSGEGSFSECLLLTSKTNPSDVAILKIIPFDLSSAPTTDTNPDSLISNSTIDAVLREVQILSALSPHHGFAQLRSCHVVRGAWHPDLLHAYRTFRESHPDLAINPLPSERWNDDMVYGLIEMEDAGADLESLTKPSAFQVFDAFWTSVVLLAVAEKEREFEHRDLHMSNICFKERSRGEGYDISAEKVRTMKCEPEVLLGMTNLKITIIDYTMSRLRLQAKKGEGGGGGEVLFNPESAWSGAAEEGGGDEGNGAEAEDEGAIDHQTLTGRRMRNLASQYARGLEKWVKAMPQTNIFWLAHLLHQLLRQAGARPRHILGSSAIARKLQTKMWKQLQEVLKLIDTDGDGLQKAGLGGSGSVGLLGMAMEKGWLREEDVKAFMRGVNDDV